MSTAPPHAAPFRLLYELLTFSHGTRRSSLGVAALERRSGAGGGAQAPPVALPAPTQHKVVVGGGAHGVEYVGFVGQLKIWGRRRDYRI